MALGVAFLIGGPSLAHASDVIKYDATNLDDILIQNGIEVDQERVQARREIAIKENPKIQQLVVKEKPKVYPKTAIYTNVVDISEHQNPSAINYDLFAKEIDGAILRSSITTYKEDKKTGKKTYHLRRDYTVDTHYNKLNQRGVPIGFYHYSRATNPEEATKEANYVLDYIKDKNVSLPIYMDIEDDLRQAKASRSDLSKAAHTFINIMERNGYVAGVYSYPYFAKKHLSKDIRNRGNFWIADYVGKEFTGYTDTEFDAWQYAHTGRVAGYSGNIDKNILYKDYPLIIKGKSKKNYELLLQEIIDGHWSDGKEREKRLKYAGYDYNKVQADVNRRLSLNK